MLIKRVAWLKRGQGRKVEKSLGRGGKWLMAVVMAAIALGVAGIRGAERNDVAGGDGGAGGMSPLSRKRRRSRMIRSRKRKHCERSSMCRRMRSWWRGVSPSEIAKLPAVAPFAAMFNKEAGFEKKYGLKLSDLANVEFVRRGVSISRTVPQYDRLIVQTKEPHDWKGVVSGFQGRQCASGRTGWKADFC